MAETMMTLGGFRYSLDTAAYQDLSRTHGWDWQEQSKVGTGPALQYTGQSAEMVSMRGRIFAEYKGGLAQIDNMKAEADKAAPLLLIDGRGNVWGEYVITSINEGQTEHWADGTPRVQNFSITLKRYGD